MTYCGECPFFKWEDTYGYGICDISGFAEKCSMECSFCVFDQLTKDQYSDPEKTLKYFKNPESGKCKIMKFIKISKYIDIKLEVLDKEGNPLMYSDSIKKWVDPDDALSMGYFVTKRLSPRKLRRLLKKWQIPKGYAVYARLYGIKYMHLPIKLTSFTK